MLPYPLLWRLSGDNDEVATTAAAVGRSNRNGSCNCRRLIVHETKLIHRRLRTSPTYSRVVLCPAQCFQGFNVTAKISDDRATWGEDYPRKKIPNDWHPLPTTVTVVFLPTGPRFNLHFCLNCVGLV